MKESVLSKWKAQNKNARNTPIIPKAPEGIPIPLSNAQQRLWFLQQLYPASAFYNYAESYTLKGPWDIAKLKESVHGIYRTHEILRSYCSVNEDGIFLQSDATKTLSISEYDFSHLAANRARQQAERLISEETGLAFVLDRGPLIRVSLMMLATDHHILTITLHHIIIDEWSMEVLLKKLAKRYKGPVNNDEIPSFQSEMQFKDYAHWESQRTFGPEQLAYWKEKLSGEIPILNLQTDKKRPIRPSYEGKNIGLQFSRELSKNLFELSVAYKVTPFVLMLSFFYIVLFKHTGQTDVLVGSPIANRNQKVFENVLGFFVETLVLRTQFEGSITFKELLALVRSNTLEAFSNKGVPFDTLVKELNPGRSLTMNPFFQVMFVYNAGTDLPVFGNNLSFEKNDLVTFGTSKFDMTLFVSENDGMLSTSIEYATDLFEEASIKRLLSHLEILSKNISGHEDTPISAIPILTDREVQFFQRKPHGLKISSDTENGIHQLFEKKVLQYPNRNAITFGMDSMTYQELNAKADRVAKLILRHSLGKNEAIGLMVPRSLDMIVGLLAILKSGAAYVPLDPEYPKNRIAYILKDSKINLVLTDASLAERFYDVADKVLLISDSDDVASNDSIEFPMINSEDLAYVIYTSGSTGKPKGVTVTHSNIIASTKARFEYYADNPAVFLLLSSISFDSSKAGIFWTLCTGGNLVISENRMEQDMTLMENVITQNRVTHLLLLPTLYQLVLEFTNLERLASLSTVIVAGESCPEQLPGLHFQKLPTTQLYNEYGPTEATVWCAAYPFEKGETINRVPIGKAIPGTKIYLLDANLEFVPYGAIGELYIAGQGLSRGYLNNTQSTQSSFIEAVLTKGSPKQRLYKTGDLGRYRNDENIEFLGRADQQVKLRGYRIELDEIESVLMNHPLINAAVVTLTSHEEGDLDLNSYSSQTEELISMITQYATIEVGLEILDSITPNSTESPTLKAKKVAPENFKDSQEKLQKDFLSQQLQGLGEKGRELFLIKMKQFLLEKGSMAPQSNSAKKLVAYVIPESNFHEDKVLSYLQSQLPKHMLPSKMVALEQFPKLPNGKVDKVTLQKKGSGIQNNVMKLHDETMTDTEEKLMAIWEETLGIFGLSVNDNFFQVGGDSIMSIQIIAKARKEGLAITPNQLFEYQTISQLSDFIDANKSKGEQWDYMIPLRRKGSKNPLFCIHAGGGHVFFYNKLADYLDSEVPIYALQPSGMYGQKPMHENIVDMTKAYLEAIKKVRSHGPYNILVYCFSAAVGNEMAILLNEMGEEINLIVMDTMTAPAVLNTPRRLKIRARSFLMRLLRSPVGSVKGMIISKYSILRTKWNSKFDSDTESKELEKLRLNLMRMSRNYVWKKLPGKVSLILTPKGHKSLNDETIRSWKEITESEIAIHYTDGDHRMLFDEPYVNQTAMAIEKCLIEKP